MSKNASLIATTRLTAQSAISFGAKHEVFQGNEAVERYQNTTTY